MTPTLAIILIAALQQSSPPASPLAPAAESMRAVKCDQDRAKAAADGWDTASIHLSCEPGIVPPVRTHTVNPGYTTKALRAKIQGVVKFEAVVEPDGRVREARVVQSLDRVFGLDDEALKAIRASKFTPGTLNGEPARILLSIEMQFTMR